MIDHGVLDVVYPSLAALQQAVSVVDETRMRRVHGTTGEPPAARWIRERAELRPLPPVPFDPRLPETRRVLSDCVVSFQGAKYSVPHVHVGSKVTVKQGKLRATNVKNCLGMELPAFVAIYRSARDFIGQDRFTLEVTGSNGKKQIQQVTVTVMQSGHGQGI